ncbi:hypothetical protein D3C85_949860 [compost metagenome]
MRRRQLTLCVVHALFGTAIGLAGSECGLVELVLQSSASLNHLTKLLFQLLLPGLGLIQRGLDRRNIGIGASQRRQILTKRLQLALCTGQVDIFELQLLEAL